jgi:hypothetical protein
MLDPTRDYHSKQKIANVSEIRIVLVVLLYNRGICRSLQKLQSHQKIAIVSEIRFVIVILLYSI